ncbi:MAG: hypothetical protein NC092_04410 [Butyrivibrio sp.]|nr:hypothetical protein [Muribaculum sp.]MCM1551918.1 hypothetical protein [Butyrivibrio sp.]
MRKTFSKLIDIVYIALFLLLTICILTNSRLSLRYAFTGLELWFQSMIPTLLPFMILSGTLIRMGLTEGFTTLLYPLVKPLFRVSRNVCYVMIMGFMCGFPMGANCVNDMYAHHKLNHREAEYLLAFCNNIGPIYFVSFALPLIGCMELLPCVLGMYGLPLLYGLLLRYTLFRDLRAERLPEVGQACLSERPSLFKALHESIYVSMQSILMLGGYMVLFNLLMLVPHLLTGQPPRLLAPILEITGGLKLLGSSSPLYSLIILPFGGCCCIAQTYTCIQDSELSIRDYVLHKLLLTALTAVYYLLCLRFLRFR